MRGVYKLFQSILFLLILCQDILKTYKHGIVNHQLCEPPTQLIKGPDTKMKKSCCGFGCGWSCGCGCGRCGTRVRVDWWVLGLLPDSLVFNRLQCFSSFFFSRFVLANKLTNKQWYKNANWRRIKIVISNGRMPWYDEGEMCSLLKTEEKNKLVVVTMEEFRSVANEGNQGTLHQRLCSTFQDFLSYTPSTNAT